MRTDGSRVTKSRRSARERGQVLPLFALMSVVFLGGAALLTDVAWWWTFEQRMQRAADAGALAGAIFLPGNEGLAFSAAIAEATKNGFFDGAAGAVVTPRRDPDDPRKLIVDIDAAVSTNFARVFCWQGGPCLDSVDVGVTGAASYVLPVPMGSPQDYYGVGFFQGMIPGTSNSTPGETAWLDPTSSPNGSWTNPHRAYLVNENPSSVRYATRVTDSGNSISTMQAYSGWGATFPADAVVTGIEIKMEAYSSDSSGCAIRVALNQGTPAIDASSWDTATRDVNLNGSSNETTSPATVGGATDMWGRNDWTAAELTTFRVRVQALDPGSNCTNGSTTSLDHVEVKLHYTTTVTTAPSYPVLSVPNPSGGTLASQGFWGAIFTAGGVRENGDRYAPQHIGGNSPPDGTNGGPNPDHDVDGYDYTIEVGANGQVRIFDPIFCATGPNQTGGWFGAGDHWTTDGTGGDTTIGPVAVRFRLFNTNGTPHTTDDDSHVGSDLMHDPGSQTLGDFSGSFGTPQNSGVAGSVTCAADPGHNQWVLPAGWSGLTAGTYRLNVNTSFDSENLTMGAENLFSIWVKGDGRARVYGGGRMAAYTNLDQSGATQSFYFSQIDAVHAGKTMVITLFDPGEANDDSYLRFLSPQGGTYEYADFTWTSNDGRSGSGTEIQTASSEDGALFNNRLLTIEIPLDPEYATADLDPDGLGEDGWWKVEYDVRAANDTTTWEVGIQGNPVHLVEE